MGNNGSWRMLALFTTSRIINCPMYARRALSWLDRLCPAQVWKDAERSPTSVGRLPSPPSTRGIVTAVPVEPQTPSPVPFVLLSSTQFTTQSDSSPLQTRHFLAGTMSNTVADNTVANLFAKHPTNKVLNGGNKTQSNKPWTQNYHPIHDLRVHTRLYRDGKTYADFETAFLAWEEDDNLRISAQAVDPNRRTWLFETEADCELWFHSEISNVILPAWSEFPLVTQSSHTKPSGNENISEEVDAVYSVASGARATVLAIGEMKRNLIRSSSWQDGNITKNVDQIKLSQELRGYVHFESGMFSLPVIFPRMHNI